MNVHRSRAAGLVLNVVTIVMAAGCLTLTTTDESAGGSAGDGGTSPSSSSAGGLSGSKCTHVQDCPDTSICESMECKNGYCISGFAPIGSSCSGDGVCDGNGACVECLVNKDCLDSTASCDNNHCVSCNDGQQNGQETGVDCGGSQCNPCLMAMCTNGGDCATGNCVDGVCCDTPCTDACKTCNLTGKVGKCANLPSGTEDPGVCDTTKACSGFGGACKFKNGQMCQNDGDCLSNSCFFEVCKPN